MSPTPEQRAYVEAERERGTSPAAIAETLRAHGYSEAVIASLLPESATELPVPPPPPSAPPLETRLPSFFTLLGSAFQLCTLRPDVCGVLAVAAAALAAAAHYANADATSGALQLASGLGTLFILVGFYLSVFAAMRAFLLRGHETLEQSFSWVVSRRIFSIIWISLLSTLVVVTGFIFFVIPAIVVSGYLFFSVPVFLKEEVRGMAALVRSTVLIRGRWWGVMWRYLLACIVIMFPVGFVQGVLSFVPLGPAVVNEVISGVVGLVGTVGMLTFVIVLYEALALERPHFDPAAHVRLRRLYIGAAIFGAVILPVLIVLLLVLLVGVAMSMGAVDMPVFN